MTPVPHTLHNGALQATDPWSTLDLPEASKGLAPTLDTIAEAARAWMGPGSLLTVNALVSYPLQAPVADDTQLLLQRIWSSNPAAYPVTGQKRKTMTAWTRQLLVDGQVFVGEGDAAITQHFADHPTIAALDLHSVVNVPLCDHQGLCYATFNLLGAQPSWTDQDLLRVRTLAALAAPAIALHCQNLVYRPDVLDLPI